MSDPSPGLDSSKPAAENQPPRGSNGFCRRSINALDVRRATLNFTSTSRLSIVVRFCPNP